MKLLALPLITLILLTGAVDDVAAQDWSFSYNQSSQGSWSQSGPGYSASQSYGTADSLSIQYQNGQLQASQSSAFYNQGSYQTPTSQGSFAEAGYQNQAFQAGPNGYAYQSSSGYAQTQQGSQTTPWGQSSWSHSESHSQSSSYSNFWGGP
jgi:hypothetical protein